MFSILILDVSGSMENYYNDLIDMANKIIENQTKNPINEGILIFFGSYEKTIINKKYRILSTSDINNSHVGIGTNFYNGFNEASQYLEYG